MISEHRLREHALLSLSVVLTRVALYTAGVRFNFALDWMWLGDPADLRDRLAETLYYFHAFPPGMNLLTGVLIKIGGEDASALALATFWLLGLVLVNALFHLLRVAGLSGPVALGVSTAFALLPQTIYFEHLYLYEHPVTAMLAGSAVLFHAAVRRPTTWQWVGFFLLCSAVGFTRSTFHLVWFGAMVGLALWFAGQDVRGRVLRAACLPATVLLVLYVKNFVLFGVFDAFSFGPVSQSLVTVERLPSSTKEAWIEERKLSRFAGVSAYAGPEDYLPLLAAASADQWRADDWPPQVTRLYRPSIPGAPNYNHWVFLEVNRTRRQDALRYVVARPAEYFETVRQGVTDLFAASTEWHPRDRDASPHAQHRLVLGRYEALFNAIVHGVPVPPVGLYAVLPFVMGWAALRARSLVRSSEPDARALGALVVFCLVQIAYVTTVSTLFTFRESARYRFQVEPLIWVLGATCVAGGRPRITPRV